MMNDHYKTIETGIDPCIVVTNLTDDNYYVDGSVLLGFYYAEDGAIGVPRLTTESEGVQLLNKYDVQKLIKALQEFVE
jgi:hypothetical protein